ncbi:hypothetical protein [Flavobacterium chungangense]|uniref:hypothetical protein n=1 Tax=Flavobacterium chungangense TaxID=554283 RepID=UPI00068EFA52|nr:hypothetical protein [Flavobacterium chungangense]
MTKTLNFIVLFFSIITFVGCRKNADEIQRQYFVDDSKNVEILSVNYCVDNFGNVSSVAIIPEKTTYKNKEKIKEVIDDLKNIYFSPDSEQRNECHDYNFIFINPKYENNKLDSSKISKCYELRKGTYKYVDGSFPEITIIRNDEFQIEKNQKQTSKFKIEWPNDTNYILTYLTGSNKRLDFFIGRKIYVEIIDILSDGSYVYRATLTDGSLATGILKKNNS